MQLKWKYLTYQQNPLHENIYEASGKIFNYQIQCHSRRCFELSVYNADGNMVNFTFMYLKSAKQVSALMENG